MRVAQATLVAAGLAALALVLAGCVGSPNPGDQGEAANATPEELPEPVTVLTDPEGDQREENDEWAQSAAPCLQADDAPEQPPCQAPGTPADDTEPAGGVPTSPARDVLEARFQETPTTLEVFLDVGELSEGFEEAVDGYNSTWYFVSWQTSNGCWELAGLYVWPATDRVEIDSGSAVICQGSEEPEGPNRTCRSVCFWDTSFEVEFGQPATLHWTIPRQALIGGDVGHEIREPVAETVYLDSSERWLSIDGRVSTAGTWRTSGSGYAYDRSQAGENFTFETELVPEPLESGALKLEDSDDVQVEEPPSRPDLQIDELAFDPTPRMFRLSVQLAEVAETPENHTLFMRFGVPGGTVTTGYEAEDGERKPFANLFPADGGNPVSIPAKLEVEPGTPGRVTLELAREDLPAVEEGALLQVFWAITQTSETREASAGGLGGLETQTEREGDWSLSAPLHRLEAGETAEDPTVRIGDAVGDVEPPPDLTESRDRYDLQGAEVVSRVPDEMRFSISVADLSEPDPPPEYDAVFYAVGVEHSGGETMIGHYRSRDRPGGEFLCAPDTTVLADEPADPTQSVWTTVEGTIQTASSGGGRQGSGGGAGSAALLVTAPASCFGLTEGAEELNVTALEAGSYLLRRSQAGSTTVEELDSMAAEEGFVAPFAEPVETQPSFWAQPFGVDNFWDIVGVTLAAITVLVSVGLFYRRRRAFHRYLDEIQRIQEDYRHDPSARAAALVELRRRLRRDLERHRVNDSHYPIILDRLRTRLTSARLTSLGQGFYEIPSRISLRIERLLDDGYLSEEECEVLEPVIKESDMPDAQATELVDRLHKWVEEDAGEVAE